MAKVKRKKQVTARTEPMGVPLPTARTGMIGAQIPTAMMGPNPQLTTTTPAQTGSLTGLRAGDMTQTPPEGMKQQIESREMRMQGVPAAKPAPMPKAKVKRKKSEAKAAIPSEPLSPQTWANIGNNPLDYPEYLAAWKKQSGKK
jgi:hypothetical protein